MIDITAVKESWKAGSKRDAGDTMSIISAARERVFNRSRSLPITTERTYAVIMRVDLTAVILNPESTV